MVMACTPGKTEQGGEAHYGGEEGRLVVQWRVMAEVTRSSAVPSCYAGDEDDQGIVLVSGGHRQL